MQNILRSVKLDLGSTVLRGVRVQRKKKLFHVQQTGTAVAEKRRLHEMTLFI